MDGAFTGKTGFTNKAGYCYVGALERDGKCMIVALLPVGGRIIRPINGVTAESCLDMDWKILFTGSSERKNFPDGNSTYADPGDGGTG